MQPEPEKNGNATGLNVKAIHFIILAGSKQNWSTTVIILRWALIRE